MKAKLWCGLTIALPILAALFGGVAVREHMARKAGGYAAVTVGDVPLSEIAAGLTALAAAIGSAVAAFRRSSGGTTPDDEQTHLAALAGIYLAQHDRTKLDLVRDLGAPAEAKDALPTVIHA